MAEETFLTIASQRDTRNYADRPLPADLERRILESGRVAGSGKNRQDRRFIVVRESRESAAELVTRRSNLRTGAFVVAIAVPESGSYATFDAARAAQNMMLTAWSEGVASCPNALADADAMARLLGLAADERVAVLVSFGYPANGREPGQRGAEEWLERADRLPLDEVVEER